MIRLRTGEFSGGRMDARRQLAQDRSPLQHLFLQFLILFAVAPIHPSADRADRPASQRHRPLMRQRVHSARQKFCFLNIARAAGAGRSGGTAGFPFASLNQIGSPTNSMILSSPVPPIAGW